jgi:hypothetical protein
MAGNTKGLGIRQFYTPVKTTPEKNTRYKKYR